MVHPGHRRPRVGDNPVFRRSLIAFVLVMVALMIVAPLVVIAVEAFSRGVGYISPRLPIPTRGTPSC
jgi:sulfate transport system permease protein